MKMHLYVQLIFREQAKKKIPNGRDGNEAWGEMLFLCIIISKRCRNGWNGLFDLFET